MTIVTKKYCDRCNTEENIIDDLIANGEGSCKKVIGLFSIAYLSTSSAISPKKEIIYHLCEMCFEDFKEGFLGIIS